MKKFVMIIAGSIAIVTFIWYLQYKEWESIVFCAIGIVIFFWALRSKNIS